MKKKYVVATAFLLLPLALSSTKMLDAPIDRIDVLQKAEGETEETLSSFLAKARNGYDYLASEVETLTRKDNGAYLTSSEYRHKGSRTRDYYQESISLGGQTYSTNVRRDEKGRPSREFLSYDNTVSTYALSNTSFDIDMGNPFVYVLESDFRYSEAEQGYVLDEAKAYGFCYRLLALDYRIEAVVFHFEDGAFKDIEIRSPAMETVLQDAYTYDYIKADVTYETTVRLSNLGQATPEKVQPAQSRDKEHEDALEKAFKGLGDNFTIVISEHYRDEEPDPEFATYMYYDGEHIYHQLTQGDVTSGLFYTQEKDRPDGNLYVQGYEDDVGKWVHFTAVSTNSYNAKADTYENLLPKYPETSPYLFAYDAERDVYYCDIPEALCFLGNPLSPGVRPITDFTTGNCDKAEVTLKSDGSLESVTVGYTYEDSQGYELQRDITMRFVNVGTTTLPEGFTGVQDNQ